MSSKVEKVQYIQNQTPDTLYRADLPRILQSTVLVGSVVGSADYLAIV